MSHESPPPVVGRRDAVPFLDLRPIHEGLAASVLAEMAGVIDTGAFVNGAQVHRFEEAFASYCGAAHCVGVASGLDALRLALIGAGVGPGDDVLVPAMTFVATFEAVSQVGARPVPVDVSDADYCMDVDATAAAVGRRTRALLPVHLYGQLADLKAIRRIAAERSLVTVEDACQAHGAARDQVRAGSGSDAAAFSFYPGKNLGAFGDAGCLVTGDAELARRVRSLREHGQSAKYVHDEVGYTARLDTLQAVALLHKLPHLDGWNAERRAVAARYLTELADVGDLVLPPVPAGSEPVWHLFVVRTGHRDELAAFLRERGIATGMHYPQPPHLSPAYVSLGHREGEFPVAEAIAAEGLSLPIFPGMTDDQAEAVIAAVLAFFDRG
jgi:dTDP-4-amino-4,6-dideoxygalactose transaminase